MQSGRGNQRREMAATKDKPNKESRSKEIIPCAWCIKDYSMTVGPDYRLPVKPVLNSWENFHVYPSKTSKLRISSSILQKLTYLPISLSFILKLILNL